MTSKRYLKLPNGSKWFFLLFAAWLTMGAGLLAIYSKGDWVLMLDHLQHPYGNFVFRYLTFIGDGWFYALAIIALSFWRTGEAITGLFCFAVSGGGAQILKVLIFPGMARPIKYFDGLHELSLIDGVRLYTMYSFPSGHTTTAFSLMTLLALLFPSKKTGVIFFCLAMLAAISRVYLVQHFFIDIYFGSILGTTVSLSIYLLFARWSKPQQTLWWQRSLIQNIGFGKTT